MKRPFVLEPSGEVGFIAARFSAWGAYHFFSFPLREVADQFVDLEFLGNQRAKEIEYQIISEENIDKRVDLLQEVLQMQFSENSRQDRTVDYSLFLIRASKGLISIRDLARTVGSSERQLLRKFRLVFWQNLVSNRGHVKAFNATSGNLAWSTQVQDGVRMLRASEHFICASCSNGMLYALLP